MKKIKAKQKELKKILGLLKEAEKIIQIARDISSKTAFCCESSLDGLLDEISNNISYTDEHLKTGIHEQDLIRGVK